MRLPIDAIDKAKVVYVMDDAGNKLPLPIPLKGGVTLPETELVDRIEKEYGKGAIDGLIKTIAEKVAPQNGNDPVKVATALVKYRDGESYPDPIEDYRGYFLIHCSEDFDKLESQLKNDAAQVGLWRTAARVHAILSRVPAGNYPTKAGDFKWNPKDWKTEFAFDSEKLPVAIRRELDLLFQTEQAGVTDRYVEHVNPDEAPAYDKFNFASYKPEITQKEEAATEPETAEATAKK